MGVNDGKADASGGQLWEKVVGSGIIVLFAVITAIVVLRNEPIKDQNIVVIVRVVLAFMAGFLGWVIPGLLHVEGKFKGWKIRGSAGFAFAVIVYFFTPTVLPEKPAKADSPEVIQSTTGDQSPTINTAGATVGRDLVVSVNSEPSKNMEDILTKGLPQDEHPVIDLSEPIESQVQLFPEDKVRIYADPSSIREVWLGKHWEPADFNREYMVWGVEGKPVIPKFRGSGELKLEITYTRYRNIRRDKRNYDGMEVKKE